MSDISFKVGREYDTNPPASIEVTVNVTIPPDAPPALVVALGEMLGRLVSVGTDEATANAIVDYMQEVKERKQREADNVARLLLGEEE